MLNRSANQEDRVSNEVGEIVLAVGFAKVFQEVVVESCLRGH